MAFVKLHLKNHYLNIKLPAYHRPSTNPEGFHDTHVGRIMQPSVKETGDSKGAWTEDAYIWALESESLFLLDGV